MTEREMRPKKNKSDRYFHTIKVTIIRCQHQTVYTSATCYLDFCIQFALTLSRAANMSDSNLRTLSF